ncbi:MAG: PH domain-containing protein [Pseudomonadota bacterium]
MSYIEESLSSGEEVVAIFKLHWFSRLPMVLWIILALPTLGLTLILAGYEFVRLRCIEQGLTNKRVVFKKGIISRSTEEMKLKSVETVEIEQGVLGRIFGYGEVKITGRGISDVVFRGVADPIAVKKQIESVSNPVD